MGTTPVRMTWDAFGGSWSSKNGGDIELATGDLTMKDFKLFYGRTDYRSVIVLRDIYDSIVSGYVRRVF